MVVFNLPSTGILPDGTTRTTDPIKQTFACLQLCVVELVLFFCTVFVQYRFHDVDIARVFKKAELEYERSAGGPRNIRVFSYRFWMYLLMGLIFFLGCMARGEEGESPTPQYRGEKESVHIFLRIFFICVCLLGKKKIRRACASLHVFS